jgi:hypothetical protein
MSLLESKYFLLSDKIIIKDIQAKLSNAIKNNSMEKKTDKL